MVITIYFKNKVDNTRSNWALLQLKNQKYFIDKLSVSIQDSKYIDESQSSTYLFLKFLFLLFTNDIKVLKIKFKNLILFDYTLQKYKIQHPFFSFYDPVVP